MLKFQRYLVFGGLGFRGGSKGVVEKVEISMVLRGEGSGKNRGLRVVVLVACPTFHLNLI